MVQQQPSSPGKASVDMKQCIEEVVKFTLESHVNQTLEFNLPFSKDFSSFLLQRVPLTTDSSDKESQYPLDKRLALALYKLLTCTVLSEMHIFVDIDLKKKEEWKELILEEGSEIVKLLKSINFELHVQEPFFTQLRDGVKTVEGRCAVGDYNRICSGALILFNKCLVLEVQEIHHYGSFSEMLQAESLAKVLPGIKAIDEGVQVYRKFYTEEKERSNGVLAICVARSAAQPYLYLARILSGLSYEGLQSLLGLPDQAATIAQPPTSQAGLSSSVLQSQPNVRQ